MKPLWTGLPYELKPIPFNFGDGINNGLPLFDIKESELVDCLNVDSREYPALNVRAGRSLHSTITTPKMLSQRNNNVMWCLDGTAVKQYVGGVWTNLFTGLTSADAKTEDLVTGTNSYTIFSNGTERKYASTSGGGDIPGMPATKLFTSHKGRIYALTSNDIKFCALNLITDWTKVNDAGSIDISRAKGNGTAITTFADHVVAWSKYSMHELWGTGPSNFTLTDVSLEIGCVADKSVKEIKGILYWLGQGHVHAYSGGTKPESISFKVKDYMARINWAAADKAVSGTDGTRYYLAVPIDGATTNNILLVFDTETGNWYVESGNFVDFVEMEGKFYGLASDGKIYDMLNGTADYGSDISWYAITKPFNENNLSEKKSWHRLFLICDLPSGSTLNIGLSNSAKGNNFTTVKSITADSNIQRQQIEIPLSVAQNADWVRLKLSGTGPCTIHKLERHLRQAKRW